MEDFFTRALSTSIGALFAFGLAAWREKSKERSSQVEKFKTALFILLLQRTFLRNLYAQQLAPHRDNSIRNYSVLNILAAPPVESVDVPALAFLLSGNSQLVNELMVAQEKYRALVSLIEVRNEVHLKFQAKLEAARQAAPEKEGGTPDDIKRIAGPVIAAQLQKITNELYSGSEDAIRFNREALGHAHAAFKKLFPGTDIFGVEDIPLAELSKGANESPR